MNFDLGAIVMSLLGSLGITSAAWGTMKTKLEHLEGVVAKHSERLHQLANENQLVKIKQVQEINGLRQEMHEDFVTFRQLDDLKRDTAETRDDIKTLIKMVAGMAVRQKKPERWGE